MRLSRYFLPILRETPKEAEIASHRLMLRAGMMRQEAAGIYAFLPLGLRVLRKIENVVRSEMNAIGGQEILLPADPQVHKYLLAYASDFNLIGTALMPHGLSFMMPHL